MRAPSDFPREPIMSNPSAEPSATGPVLFRRGLLFLAIAAVIFFTPLLLILFELILFGTRKIDQFLTASKLHWLLYPVYDPIFNWLFPM